MRFNLLPLFGLTTQDSCESIVILPMYFRLIFLVKFNLIRGKKGLNQSLGDVQAPFDVYGSTKIVEKSMCLSVH